MSLLANNNRIRVWLLISLMAVVAMLVAGLTLIILYNAAYKQQSKRLMEMAQSQAHLFEVMVKNNNDLTGRSQADLLESITAQFRSAYSRFNDTGDSVDFIIATTQNNTIHYLLMSGVAHKTKLSDILQESAIAEPMRKALSNQSGVGVSQDNRGNQILAAYEPIGVFNLGIVAKIDLNEFESPFIRAGAIAAGVGLIFIIAGTFFIFRISAPLLRSVEQNKNQLKTILDTVVDGILSINTSGVIETINPSAAKMFGYRDNELLGCNIDKLIPQQLRNKHKGLIASFVENKTSAVIGVSREIMGQRQNGSLFPIEIALSQFTIDNQKMYTGVIRDITERKRTEKELRKHREILEEQVALRTRELANANKQLKKLARSDGLTGIANRRVFDEELKREIKRSSRVQSIFSLLICDIDFFKNYNDSYGHPQGDQCLKQIAEVINSSFHRTGDIVARYGGEEFAIILPGVETKELVDLAELLRLKVWELGIPHGNSAVSDRVTISIGAASFKAQRDWKNEKVIKIADDALYEAKRKGRNRIEVSSTITVDNVAQL